MRARHSDQLHLNGLYWHALRAAAAANPAEACAKFGVSVDVAELASTLSIGDITALSLSSQVVFRPVLDAFHLRKLLAITDQDHREILFRVAQSSEPTKTKPSQSKEA